jgi:hypothetical protein
VKKSHQRFQEIVREHFAAVEPREFKARLHDASHGEFGEPATEEDDTEPKLKGVMRRAARAVAAGRSRLLALLHLH